MDPKHCICGSENTKIRQSLDQKSTITKFSYYNKKLKLIVKKLIIMNEMLFQKWSFFSRIPLGRFSFFKSSLVVTIFFSKNYLIVLRKISFYWLGSCIIKNIVGVKVSSFAGPVCPGPGPVCPGPTETLNVYYRLYLIVFNPFPTGRGGSIKPLL